MKLKAENETLREWRKVSAKTGEEKMTKKDYELVARAFRIVKGSIKVTEYDAETALDLASIVLADSLEKTNPRFNRAKFLEACASN